MDQSCDHLDVVTRTPALAESEDIESEDTDFDAAEYSHPAVIDRYGFSGGQQYTDPNKEFLPPIDVLRSREMKWLSMCRNWDYWSTTGIKKLRERCRKGIPDSMRCEAWQRLVGSATTKFQQNKAFIAEPVESQDQDSSPLRKLFGSYSRLSGSRSLPTVVTNSPSTGRSQVLESSLFYIPEFLYQRPPLPPHDTASLLPPPVASVNPSSPSVYRNSLSRRKTSNQFKSFRKFSSLFRLNSTSTTAAAGVVGSIPSADTGTPSTQPMDTEETDASNFFQRGEIPVSSQGGGERSRTYSAALPSAAYLGIAIGGGGGGEVGVRGSAGSGGAQQPSDSTTTTTSTGVSMDTYSLTNSSNFFSAAESSAESLRASGAIDYSLPNSPGPAPHNHLFLNDDGCVGEASPISSRFSTLSSTHRSSDDIDADANNNGDNSPPLSLLMLDDQRLFASSAASAAAAAAKEREATLVAPSSSAAFDPYVLYATYAAQEGDPATCDQIRKDIHRQFPFHELFCSKSGRGCESLFSILKAYTIRHPNKGYCQGQAPLAAVLLMFMPEAEAFWTFTEICERYLVSYYDEGLELIQIDGQILYGLLKRLFPQIYKFLMKHGAEPIILVVEWFMCVYTRTLPWTSALRVLDMFFCEGKIIIFKVGLLLLYRCFSSATFRKSCGGLDEIILQAQTVPSQLDNPEELVHDMLQIRIDRRQVAREVMKQSQRWRARMSVVLEKSNEK